MKAPANYMPPRPSPMEANLQQSLNEVTTSSTTGPRHSVADIEGMLRELQKAQAAGDDMGFFFTATVQPLYEMMKRASVKEESTNVCAGVLCCSACMSFAISVTYMTCTPPCADLRILYTPAARRVQQAPLLLDVTR